MTTAQAIAHKVEMLSEEARREVLDFAEFIAAKSGAAGSGKNHESWYDLSISSAMRDMHDEPALYGERDLKESFH